MKNQALCSSKDKSKKLKCRLLQFLCGALWVKTNLTTFLQRVHRGKLILGKWERFPVNYVCAYLVLIFSIRLHRIS